jgi:hypothetical protein
MMMDFPNPSRSFDETRNCICFWGYDKSIEVSFYLDVCALQKLSRGGSEREADYLAAFDTASNQIHKVAARIHGKRGGSVYSHKLTEDDF